MLYAVDWCPRWRRRKSGGQKAGGGSGGGDGGGRCEAGGASARVAEAAAERGYGCRAHVFRHDLWSPKVRGACRRLPTCAYIHTHDTVCTTLCCYLFRPPFPPWPPPEPYRRHPAGPVQAATARSAQRQPALRPCGAPPVRAAGPPPLRPALATDAALAGDKGAGGRDGRRWRRGHAGGCVLGRWRRVVRRRCCGCCCRVTDGFTHWAEMEFETETGWPDRGRDSRDIAPSACALSQRCNSWS